MANTKISALTAGAPAQSTDLLPIDRAGANYSLQVSDIGAEILTSPEVTKSITTGINAIGNVSGSVSTVDLSKGNVITMTLTGNTTLVAWVGAVASAGQDVTFIITQNGTGGYTLTWPTAVVPAGVAPAPSLAANSVSVFKATIDASGNANFTGNGPITVFRFRNASVTTSVGANVIFTPAAAGVYRLQGQVSCTTAGTTATMALAIYINNTAFHITSSALGSSSTSGFYESVVYPQLNMAASTASNIDYATTLTNAIGTAVFQVDITIEYLGN